MTIISAVLSFLAVYWLDIIIGTIMITSLIILWKKGQKKLVIRIIKALVVKMEQQYGSKTGAIKFEAVWSEIYAHVPWIIRIIFTEKELAGYIEDAVKWLTKLLNNNNDINLLTYAEELMKGVETDE